ncbi:receptor-like kinase [Wolffia australiana]
MVNSPLKREMEARLFLFAVAAVAAAALRHSAAALAFSPAVDHLLNCGGGAAASAVDDRRVFQSDGSPSATSLFSLRSPSRSIAIADPNPSSSLPEIYRTARVFLSPAVYRFRIDNPVVVLVIRLHFRPFPSSSVDLSSARFHVSAAGFVLLRNFTLPPAGPLVKEFLVKARSDHLTVVLTPADAESTAVINAIEVFSAPKDLLSDLAWSESDKGFKNMGLTDLAMESSHRINVGGGKVTPFNDTLWRTWTADDSRFLQSGPSNSKSTAFSGRLAYREGGASREVAPDHVYDTCRVGNSNMTWAFPLVPGYKYLVRMHFCDIVSLALNQLYFDILINGKIVYEDFDLSEAAGQTLSSPYYIDFIAGVDGRGYLTVGISPDDHGFPANHKGLLNGLEIFKLSNSVGSLDGMVPLHELCENHGYGKAYMFFRSLMCGSTIMVLVFAVFMLGKWLRKERRSSLAWLPVASEEGELGSGISLPSGKTVW